MNGNKAALIAADFTVTENLAIGDLTLASFTGSTPKTAGTGAQSVGIDPATGQQIITILAPAGGWVWECTVTPGAPETIFGIALTDNAGAVLLAVLKFQTAVVISAAGQQVSQGNITITMVANPAF